jgi:hypothetical protein
MKPVALAKIEVDGKGRLRLFPRDAIYDRIYRGGDGVEWDAKSRFLQAFGPDDWTLTKYFRRIVSSVKSEYGELLEVRHDTEWSNVPERIKSEIESAR